jgi:AAA+ superfamily predicted ATPase
MKLKSLLNAGFSGIYYVTHEEARAAAEVAKAAEETGRTFLKWCVTTGVTDAGGNAFAETEDPVAAIDFFDNAAENLVMLAHDFHVFLDTNNANPVLVRKVKDALTKARTTGKTLVICACRLVLPPELEKFFVAEEISLPDHQTLESLAKKIAEDAGVKVNGNLWHVAEAARGLTTPEAEDAFALSAVERKALDPELIGALKCQAVEKGGLLEFVRSDVSPEDIGGLDNLKKELAVVSKLFTPEAKAYGVPQPKGWLIVGQPGTGKSLTALASKAAFRLPLIRLEAGRLFGSLVGESERNWRTAFATVKAVAPCVLWIDEVDGLFAGHGTTTTDGGTTQRVLKAILQDMQFSGKDIFFLFTANDVDNLPDPLMDRLEVWSVELPDAAERAEIWRIHIAKTKRDPQKYDLAKLAEKSDGYSGRQIERAWASAMARAFVDGGREPKTEDALAALADSVPTSVLMRDQIEARRKRLANRARPASKSASVAPAGISGKRHIR